jgi:hypothetical protein
MTPKEKAEELVNKFIDYSDALPEDYDCMDPVSHCDEKQLTSAKQCALIAIDEMLDFRNGLYINEGSLAHQWLLDVKHEIEKI